MSHRDMGEPPAWVIVTFFIMIGLVPGFFFGRYLGEGGIQYQAIKRGYAEYNATTGEWQWKGEEQEVTE